MAGFGQTLNHVSPRLTDDDYSFGLGDFLNDNSVNNTSNVLQRGVFNPENYKLTDYNFGGISNTPPSLFNKLGGAGGLAQLGSLALQAYQLPSQMGALKTYNDTLKQNLAINKDRYDNYKAARQSLRDWRPSSSTSPTQVA